METEIHMSRTIAEAMEWLRKMGIDAKPALPSHKMYEFEYDNVMMLISTDLPMTKFKLAVLSIWLLKTKYPTRKLLKL